MDPGGGPGHRVRHQHGPPQDPALNCQEKKSRIKIFTHMCYGNLNYILVIEKIKEINASPLFQKPVLQQKSG